MCLLVMLVFIHGLTWATKAIFKKMIKINTRLHKVILISEEYDQTNPEYMSPIFLGKS